MQACNRCGIRIHGNKRACPLCGGPLTGEPDQPAYPVFRKKITRLTVVRMALFLMLAFFVAMIILRVAAERPISWMPLAIISALVAFGDVWITMYYRTNPIKMITWQVYIGMGICLLADAFTGWRAWSVIWVLPAAFAGLMIEMIALGGGMHLMLQDFVLYLLLNALLSLTQIIFLVTRINPFDLPALISMGACVVLLLGVLIFRWRDFKSASSRYFNM